MYPVCISILFLLVSSVSDISCMKTICIFGGTGVTGQCAVRVAVKRGLSVRVLARDPSSPPAQALAQLPNVTILSGDVLDAAAVRRALEGCEASVIALGTRNDLAATTDLSQGTKNILNAMQELGINRVSICISAFLLYQPDRVPERFRPLNDDHIRMMEAARASSADYVAVLPPHIRGDEDEKFIDQPVKVVVNPESSPGRAVSKWQLGAFLVDCLPLAKEYSRCTIGITDDSAPTS